MDTQTKTIDTWRAWLVADSAFSFALRAHFGADAGTGRYQPKRWTSLIHDAWAKVEAADRAWRADVAARGVICADDIMRTPEHAAAFDASEGRS
jgi:hypothetical protein